MLHRHFIVKLASATLFRPSESWTRQHELSGGSEAYARRETAEYNSCMQRTNEFTTAQAYHCGTSSKCIQWPASSYGWWTD